MNNNKKESYSIKGLEEKSDLVHPVVLFVFKHLLEVPKKGFSKLIENLLENEDIKHSKFTSKKINILAPAKALNLATEKEIGKNMFMHKVFDKWSKPQQIVNQVFLCRSQITDHCNKRLKIYLFSDRYVVVEMSDYPHNLPLKKRKKLSPHFKVGKSGRFLSYDEIRKISPVIDSDSINEDRDSLESDIDSQETQTDQKKRKLEEIYEKFKQDVKQLELKCSKKIKKLKEEVEEKIASALE
eukprot:gene10834-3454_t